jgi:hypothetical protein
MRCIKVKSVENAKNPALGKLIAATWRKAPESVVKIHVRRKKSKS